MFFSGLSFANSSFTLVIVAVETPKTPETPEMPEMPQEHKIIRGKYPPRNDKI